MSTEPQDLSPDLVTGNYYDKYASRNPVVQRLMRRFLDGFDHLVRASGAGQAHEVGCGEGYLLERLLDAGLTVSGTEIAPDVLALAHRRLDGRPKLQRLEAVSIYDLDTKQSAAELVVCCEVLEHLPDAEKALDQLAAMASPYLLASVPWEPWWRLLNMCRGKYLTACGNTPGHLQHWGRASFLRFISQRFEIIETAGVFPWTMLLAKRK